MPCEEAYHTGDPGDEPDRNVGISGGGERSSGLGKVPCVEQAGGVWTQKTHFCRFPFLLLLCIRPCFPFKINPALVLLRILSAKTCFNFSLERDSVGRPAPPFPRVISVARDRFRSAGVGAASPPALPPVLSQPYKNESGSF